MSEGLELVLEAIAAYWVSAIALTVLAVCGASMATLAYVFLTNARNAKLRVSLLTALYAISTFFWLFVGVSLALCAWQAPSVVYRASGIPTAAAAAILVSLLASAAIALAVWRLAPRRILRHFAPREPREDEAWLQRRADLLADFEGMPPVRLGIVDSNEPLALAVGGADRRILLSRGLLGALDRDETEGALAHELMHLRHHDAEFKIFSTVFSRILFFDPWSKFFDPAIHREREYLADEMGARTTAKPAALASALLKIAGRGPTSRAAWGLSILGPERRVFGRYPPVKERVRRLLLLADILSSAPDKEPPSRLPDA